jgi:SAM-dependent methyltransferase
VSIEDRVKWDRRYRERGPFDTQPSPFLVSLDGELPRTGAALDVAGGNGRHARWLVARGLRVTVVDVSEEGLRLAHAAAVDDGLAIETVCADLEAEPLPPGPWDLVISFLYLNRALFRQWPHVLAPGGLLVFEQPTRSNLERHERPPAPFLLEDGELPGLVQDLEVLRYEEGWLGDLHTARLVARRTPM